MQTEIISDSLVGSVAEGSVISLLAVAEPDVLGLGRDVLHGPALQQ